MANPPHFIDPYKHNTISKDEVNPSDPQPALPKASSKRLAQKDWGIREEKANANVPGYREQDNN